jgi:hypothetical protein
MQHVTLPLWTLVLLLLVLAHGCTHQSVYHLKRAPMVSDGKEQLVELDYWRFAFRSMDSEGGVQVHGAAHPRQEAAIPQWAVWIEDLWIEAYLSDERGRVLGRQLQVFDAQALDYEQGVPFSFLLMPAELGSPGRVYVSFGYRMVLSRADEHGSAPGKQDVFFASEGALTRY